MRTGSASKVKRLVMPVVTLLSSDLYMQERRSSSSRRSKMSIVKAEKEMKRITKKIAFLLWREEDVLMNNSHPQFCRNVSKINGRVKKNHLQCDRFDPSDAGCLRVFRYLFFFFHHVQPFIPIEIGNYDKNTTNAGDDQKSRILIVTCITAAHRQ
jgi:hypothetical protein